MSELQPTGGQPTPVAPAAGTALVRHPRFFEILRHILGISFWTYVLVTLLVFDFDAYAAQHLFPGYAWLLPYKILFIAAIISVLWLTVSGIVFWSCAIYTICYPFALAFHHIPAWILRQESWDFTIACVNTVLSFFTSVKYNFIGLSAFAISLVAIVVSWRSLIVLPGIAVIAAILVVLYVSRFVLIFRSSKVFQVYNKTFSFCGKHAEQMFLPVDKSVLERPVGELTASELQLRGNSLQIGVLFSRLCIFTAKRLRDYQKSKLNVVSYVLSLLVLIGFTVLSFAAIHCGLYKLEPAAFSIVGEPTFFEFFHYSFSALLFGSINEIRPILPVSEAAYMAEEFFGLVLIAIVVTVFIWVRNDREVRDLDTVIEGLQQQAVAAESRITSSYRLKNIDEALAELAKVQAGFLKLIDWLSRN